eukprot:3721956-Pyramimonas_sp.AAC.2
MHAANNVVRLCPRTSRFSDNISPMSTVTTSPSVPRIIVISIGSHPFSASKASVSSYFFRFSCLYRSNGLMRPLVLLVLSDSLLRSGGRPTLMDTPSIFDTTHPPAVMLVDKGD